MTWRVVSISRPARLALEHHQLCVSVEDETHRVPVEDLLAVILDNPQIRLSGRLLAEIVNAGAVVITGDEAHMPNGILLPFHQHSRQTEMAWVQQGWSAAFRKRCWQKVIHAKIVNQSHLLKRLGAQDAELVSKFAKHVRSGDAGHHESQAARVYWQALFRNGFRRHGTCALNGLLNYGYAILRAVVARALVGHGFLPAFGLHHANKLNAFNLADDMLEPLRPFCDALAYRHLHDAWQGKTPPTLQRQDRQVALGLISEQFLINKHLHDLADTVTCMVESLKRASHQQNATVLALPAFAL